MNSSQLACVELLAPLEHHFQEHPQSGEKLKMQTELGSEYLLMAPKAAIRERVTVLLVQQNHKSAMEEKVSLIGCSLKQNPARLFFFHFSSFK